MGEGGWGKEDVDDNDDDAPFTDGKTGGLRNKMVNLQSYSRLVKEEVKDQTWVCLRSKCVVSHFEIIWPPAPNAGDGYKERMRAWGFEILPWGGLAAPERELEHWAESQN